MNVIQFGNFVIDPTKNTITKTTTGEVINYQGIRKRRVGRNETYIITFEDGSHVTGDKTNLGGLLNPYFKSGEEAMEDRLERREEETEAEKEARREKAEQRQEEREHRTGEINTREKQRASKAEKEQASKQEKHNKTQIETMKELNKSMITDPKKRVNGSFFNNALVQVAIVAGMAAAIIIL